jgi:4-hydroxy-tetrahydrodipicolinate synthase
VAEGTNCIGVVGTTGESPTVNVEEHCEIIRVSVEQAAGRVPVMAGCGANSTHEAIELAKYAKKVGADSQLQVVPYYNKPTQEGQYQHFKAIAEAVGDLPMMLYNVPGRSVADMQHDTVLRLAQIPGIIGIKEATGNIERAQWLIRDVPRLWRVLGRRPHRRGTDAVGGHGNVSVTANVAPRLMSELCKAAMAGDVKRAMEIQFKLMPLHKNLFVEANPIPVKWAVARMGLCGATMRLPMTPLSEQRSRSGICSARRGSALIAVCAGCRGFSHVLTLKDFLREKHHTTEPAGHCRRSVGLLCAGERQDRLQERQKGVTLEVPRSDAAVSRHALQRPWLQRLGPRTAGRPGNRHPAAGQGRCPDRGRRRHRA